LPKKLIGLVVLCKYKVGTTKGTLVKILRGLPKISCERVAHGVFGEVENFWGIWGTHMCTFGVFKEFSLLYIPLLLLIYSVLLYM
jgi:hypothetical protein